MSSHKIKKGERTAQGGRPAITLERVELSALDTGKIATRQAKKQRISFIVC